MREYRKLYSSIQRRIISPSSPAISGFFPIFFQGRLGRLGKKTVANSLRWQLKVRPACRLRQSVALESASGGLHDRNASIELPQMSPATSSHRWPDTVRPTLTHRLSTSAKDAASRSSDTSRIC